MKIPVGAWYVFFLTYCRIANIAFSATALQSLEIASDDILSGKAKVTIAGGFDHQQAPPSIQDAVPYRIGLDHLLPLSSFPLSMVPIRPSSTQSLKQWWQWGASSASRIQRDSLHPSVHFKLLPFQAPMRMNKGEGEFTTTLGLGRGKLKRNRVSDWGTVNVQRPTPAAQQAPSFLIPRKTRPNLVTHGH